MAFRKLSISLDDSLVRQVALRGMEPPAETDDVDRVPSPLLATQLERYYALMARDRARLRRLLSADEVALICDACNGTLWQPESIPLLYAEIEDALQDDLADKWRVDGPALVAKLKAMSAGELFALVDAVERFWNGSYHKTDVDWSAVLR